MTTGLCPSSHKKLSTVNSAFLVALSEIFEFVSRNHLPSFSKVRVSFIPSSEYVSLSKDLLSLRCLWRLFDAERADAAVRLSDQGHAND
jgi:hypothetical protein